LFLIIISGLFAVTSLSVCTTCFHNTVTSPFSHTYYYYYYYYYNYYMQLGTPFVINSFQKVKTNSTQIYTFTLSSESIYLQYLLVMFEHIKAKQQLTMMYVFLYRYFQTPQNIRNIEISSMNQLKYD